MKQPPVKLKRFKVTDSFGEVTFTDGPSKQSVMEDLQRMGVLDKDTRVEEVTSEEEQRIASAPPMRPASQQDNAPPKIFSMPGGKKIKDDNGKLYSLEWTSVTRRAIIERMNCEDVKLPEGLEFLEILDWVELEPEGEKDASKTDPDV